MKGIIFAVLVVGFVASCGKGDGRASAKPPDGQILRDAEDTLRASGRGVIEAIDLRVEKVDLDEYEKDNAKAIVSYKIEGTALTGELGLSYRRQDDFWKLEGTADLGLK